MKLEQQVTSLEISKRLKELGVKQESIFYYHNDNCKFNLAPTVKLPEADNICSAFTVAELGEMLPKDIKYDVSEHGYRSLNLSSGRTIINDGWYVMYSDPHPANKVPIHAQHADTEADARGKMLIYLLENNLIK